MNTEIVVAVVIVIIITIIMLIADPVIDNRIHSLNTAINNTDRVNRLGTSGKLHTERSYKKSGSKHFNKLDRHSKWTKVLIICIALNNLKLIINSGE